MWDISKTYTWVGKAIFRKNDSEKNGGILPNICGMSDTIKQDYFRFCCKNNFAAFLGYNYCFLYHYWLHISNPGTLVPLCYTKRSFCWYKVNKMSNSQILLSDIGRGSKCAFYRNFSDCSFSIVYNYLFQCINNGSFEIEISIHY